VGGYETRLEEATFPGKGKKLRILAGEGKKGKGRGRREKNSSTGRRNADQNNVSLDEAGTKSSTKKGKGWGKDHRKKRKIKIRRKCDNLRRKSQGKTRVIAMKKGEGGREIGGRP